MRPRGWGTDIGIMLSDKTGDDRDMEEVIAKINDAVEEYGLRVKAYSDWEKFLKMCADQYSFVQGLYKELGV